MSGIEESCLHCENFCFCSAKQAIDELVSKVKDTALGIIDENLNATSLYKKFGKKCKKFDPIIE